MSNERKLYCFKLLNLFSNNSLINNRNSWRTVSSKYILRRLPERPDRLRRLYLKATLRRTEKYVFKCGVGAACSVKSPTVHGAATGFIFSNNTSWPVVFCLSCYVTNMAAGFMQLSLPYLWLMLCLQRCLVQQRWSFNTDYYLREKEWERILHKTFSGSRLTRCRTATTTTKYRNKRQLKTIWRIKT